MKTSARNQFSGRVASINPGAVNDEIELEIAGGQKIVAVITQGSTEHLGLHTGADAVVLVKASSVILVAVDETALFSARNRLTGTVSKLQTGAVNSQVEVDLPGGDKVLAIVTNDSARALDLAPGKPVSAMFKASSVVLAVAG